MNTYKMHIRIKILLTAVLVLGASAEINAQFAYTRVEITSGIDEQQTLLFEHQAEQVLLAANEWILKRKNTFNGSQDAFKKLINIIEPYNGMVLQDTLKTILIKTEGGLNELPNIFFYKQRGENNELVSLVLIFDNEAKLIDVKEDKMLALAEQTLRNRSSNKEIIDQTHEYVDLIKSYFNEKNSKELLSTIDSSAVVIVGQPNGTKNGVNYNRLNGKEYVTTLKNHAFLPENNLEVELKVDKVFEHPTYSNLIGVTVRQIWKSNIYSDSGNLFLLFDVQNGSNAPKLVARIWQKNSFESISKKFKPVQYFPHLVSKGIEKLSKERFDNQNGTIEIQGLSTSDFYLDISDLTYWITSGVISFSGIDVDVESLQATEDGSVKIRFKSLEDRFPSTKGILKVNEMFYSTSSTKELEVYPNRNNIVEISMESPGATYQPKVQRSLTGKLKLGVNPSYSMVSIFSSTREPAIIESFEIDSLAIFSLLEGSYIIKANKENFSSIENQILVRKGQTTVSEISLIKHEPIVFANSPQKRGLFKKYKYWIIGGAAAIVTTSAIAILRDTQGSVGIPIPPGRPLN